MQTEFTYEGCFPEMKYPSGNSYDNIFEDKAKQDQPFILIGQATYAITYTNTVDDTGRNYSYTFTISPGLSLISSKSPNSAGYVYFHGILLSNGDCEYSNSYANEYLTNPTNPAVITYRTTGTLRPIFDLNAQATMLTTKYGGVSKYCRFSITYTSYAYYAGVEEVIPDPTTIWYTEWIKETISFGLDNVNWTNESLVGCCLFNQNPGSAASLNGIYNLFTIASLTSPLIQESVDSWKFEGYLSCSGSALTAKTISGVYCCSLQNALSYPNTDSYKPKTVSLKDNTIYVVAVLRYQDSTDTSLTGTSKTYHYKAVILPTLVTAESFTRTTPPSETDT